jgi:hypothetical protein
MHGTMNLKSTWLVFQNLSACLKTKNFSRTQLCCRQGSLYTINLSVFANYFFNIPTNAHNIYTLKSTKIHIKTLNTCPYMFWSLFKTILRGACRLYFTELLRWDLLIYVRYKIVRFVDIRHFIPSVCVWCSLLSETLSWKNIYAKFCDYRRKSAIQSTIFVFNKFM